MLAALYNVPSTPPELSVWSFCNAAHHRDIIAAIFRAVQVELPEFVLDPFDPANMQTWLYQHAEMHRQMDAALGISGYDLIEVDWRDPGQLAGWIYLHANEHYQASVILGVD